MSDNLTKHHIQAAQAADLQDLLNHIAWTDVIEPAFKKIRADLATEIVNRILNKPDNQATSVEQLAGRVAGIDWVFTLLKRLLREGANSKAILKDLNINID